jgi:uncharacterized iron-regulated protein
VERRGGLTQLRRSEPCRSAALAWLQQPRYPSAMINRAFAIMMAACLLPAASVAQDAIPQPPDPSTWRVYTADGKPSSLEAIIDAAASVEVVLLGESHNDRVGHGLQLEIFQRIANRATAWVADATVESGPLPGVVLSFEMFERDIQYVLDEYTSGLITEDQFRRSTRPWTWYEEDYRPVFEEARERQIPIIAANAPRRYVNLVSREGPAALRRLTDEARRHLPPLPYGGPSDAYRAELDAIFSEHGGGGSPGGSDNGFWSQSLWDATMAYSIVESMLRWPDARVVHLVGSFHVRNGTGIPEQIERYRPGTRRLIVFVDTAEDISEFTDDVRGAGDFVILTDDSLARTNQLPGF